MEIVVKLNNQTAGRDKLARLLQYGSRAVWHLLEQKNHNRLLVTKLKSLEYNLSTFRKLLRLGRFLDVLYGALSTMKHCDATIRITLTLAKISHAVFLLTDHLLWLGRAGLARVDNKKWSRISNKYWLYAITMNLLRDAYEICRIVNADPRLQAMIRGGQLSYASTFQSAFYIALIECMKDHKDIVIDTVKNACDMFIPMTALGYTKLSPGLVGILGVVSSVAGILSMLNPLFKLSPA
ncbi:hypothetical protein B566_EDAN002353 [Ephemera danica]|nr:hypothetical protein B566_EDAN002353 [Ephemera danica]